MPSEVLRQPWCPSGLALLSAGLLAPGGLPPRSFRGCLVDGGLHNRDALGTLEAPLSPWQPLMGLLSRPLSEGWCVCSHQPPQRCGVGIWKGSLHTLICVLTQFWELFCFHFLHPQKRVKFLGAGGKSEIIIFQVILVWCSDI